MEEEKEKVDGGVSYIKGNFSKLYNFLEAQHE